MYGFCSYFYLLFIYLLVYYSVTITKWKIKNYTIDIQLLMFRIFSLTENKVPHTYRLFQIIKECQYTEAECNTLYALNIKTHPSRYTLNIVTKLAYYWHSCLLLCVECVSVYVTFFIEIDFELKRSLS